MAKKITGILIDVENEKFEVMEIDDELDTYYKILNCSCIDIVVRHIGARCKKAFDIVCDDEGLFKDVHKISAIDNLGNVQFIGNIFITGTADEEGNLTSLTEYDVAYIKSKIVNLSTRQFPKAYPMLTQCEF